jgi:hypothetical protein
VFIKSVIQAIPAHIMSCFQIPLSNCDNMRRAIADWWWGMEDGRRKLHWRAWEWLSTPKSLGGLGFKDMSLFNKAMLGRQCWRLLTEPQSLCARVLKGRYFPNGDFWHADKPRTASYTWRSILFGKELLRQGIHWGIGNGQSTQILSDRWIPGVQPEYIRLLSPLPEAATVDLLIDADNGAWNEVFIRSIF